MKSPLDRFLWTQPAEITGNENARHKLYKFSNFTIGNKHGRANVIVNELITTGSKSNILGYMSIGDNVPDVITTLWKRWKIDLMAIEESRQLKCNIGLATVGVLSSNGSTMIVKPFVYVDKSVAKYVI